MLSTYFGYQFKQVLRKLLNGADVLDRIDTKSFDDPMTDEEDAPTRGDITPDPESGAGFERVDMLVWRNTELFTYRTSDNLRQTSYYTPLHKALDSLAPADRKIIELRFFSLPGAVMSYTDMGERLGISLECVRQRLNNALNKLRRGRMGIWLRKVYGDDYTAHTFGDSLATYRRYSCGHWHAYTTRNGSSAPGAWSRSQQSRTAARAHSARETPTFTGTIRINALQTRANVL